MEKLISSVNILSRMTSIWFNFYIKHFRFCFIAIGCCLLTLAFTLKLSAQTQNLEYSIKSFMLFKLISYMEWAEEAVPEEEFVITVLGENPFGKLLEELAEKNQYKRKKISIRYIARIEELNHTHVLFMNKALKNEWDAIQEKIKDQPVLTISEYTGFANDGGIINFFIADGTVNMEVNLSAAGRSKIKISSLVLQLNKVKVIRE